MAAPSVAHTPRNITYATASAITPSDTTLLTAEANAFYVGSIAGGATVTVLLGDDTIVQFSGLTAGSIIPIRIKRVNSTGTLASSLVALY